MPSGVYKRTENPDKWITKKCPICKKDFKSYVVWNYVCCSRKCGDKRPKSKEHLRKLSESRKGKIGKKAANWQGGRRIHKGYVLVYAPSHPFRVQGIYIREHRLVMEKHLGRYLRPDEVVHHINHDKADNRIENLQLFTNHSEHRTNHNSPIL